jgi:TRAP-type transport system periplasmic protein
MKTKGFIVGILAVLIGLSGSQPVLAAKLMKQADLNPFKPTEVITAAAAAVFKKEVESRTNGGIEVRIYPSGTLGNERETIEQIKAGITHSYIASTGGIAPFYPLIDLINTPFLYSNIEDAYAFYESDFIRDFKEDIRKKTGLYVLEFLPVAFFQFSNSTRPIREPSDLKGLKMRTMTAPLHMEFMKALGASPTPIAWSEVYTALQTNVVDGQHNPLWVVKMGKLYEVQKYLTISNHMPATYTFIVSDKWFRSLSPEEQDIIKRSARVAVTGA